MVGDYISTSFNSGGTAATVFAVGKPHTGSVFDEAMYSPGLLSVASAAAVTRVASRRPDTDTGHRAGPGERDRPQGLR